MSISRGVVGAAFLLLASTVGHAQETTTLSLAAAVAAVDEHNPDLAAAMLETVAAGHRADRAGRWPNPEISVYQENFPGSLPDADQWIITASQRLRIGGQPGLASDAGAAAQTAADWDAKALRAELVLRVQREYVSLWAAQRSLQAVTTALEDGRRLLRDMEVRNREGDVSDFDVRRLRLEAEALEIRAREIDREIHDLGTRLGTLTGLTPPAGGWQLAAVSTEPGAPPGLEETGLDEQRPADPEFTDTKRPDLLASMSRQQEAELRRKLAGRQGVPDLMVTAGYTRLDPGLDGFVWSVTAVLPLFGRNEAAESAAAVEEGIRERRTEALAQRARAQRRQAWNAYASATEILQSLPAAADRELVRTASIAYAEGALGVTALLDTVEAELEAALRRIELERQRYDGWFRWQWAIGQSTQDEVTP